jgi:hypothetical protein
MTFFSIPHLNSWRLYPQGVRGEISGPGAGAQFFRILLKPLELGDRINLAAYLTPLTITGLPPREK